MISNRSFLKIVRGDPPSLHAQWKRLLEEELSRPEEKMRTDLIELCLDSMNQFSETEISESDGE